MFQCRFINLSKHGTLGRGDGNRDVAYLGNLCSSLSKTAKERVIRKEELSKGGDICTPVADSLCYIAEINATLEINSTPIIIIRRKQEQ